MLLQWSLLVVLLLGSPCTGIAAARENDIARKPLSVRQLYNQQQTLVLPHSRHFARLRSSMEHSLHQHRKMLLQAAAAVEAAGQSAAAADTAAAITGSAAQQQQQQQQQEQQQQQQQQMVAEFMEEGHNSVNALLIEEFQPPQNETAVEQGVPKPGRDRKGKRAATLP